MHIAKGLNVELDIKIFWALQFKSNVKLRKENCSD